MISGVPDRNTDIGHLLSDYLSRQRWFAGKSRQFTVEAVHSLDWLSAPGAYERGEPAVRIELLRVRYSPTEVDTYQLPLEYRREPAEHLTHAYVAQWTSEELGGPVFVYDHLHDKEVTGRWLLGLLNAESLAGMAFHRVDGPRISTDEHSLVLTGEQSNTSLAFGEATLLKVFRRVHHGRNPDIEIHDALTRAGGRNIADLYGWVDAEWPDESGTLRRGDLGMFSEFFRTASDGWGLAVASVRDLYAEADLHPDEVGGDFAGESYRLGATTAQVHAELARSLETSTWGRAELASLAGEMAGRLDEAVAAVPELGPFAKNLAAAFDDLEDLTEPVPVQRIHGDFHLGQTMRTVGGWRIIDFEGEPEKPLSARVRLDSPLRDIAGMLRSFDYAAQHLLVSGDATTGADEHQITYRAAEWASRNRDAFCDGYASAGGSDPRDHAALLRAYETDKAIYETVYEARMRPDWIGIPLGAVERLASA